LVTFTSVQPLWTKLRLKKKVRIVSAHPSVPVVLAGPITGRDGIYVGGHWESKSIVKFDRHALKEIWRVTAPFESAWPRAMWSEDMVLVQATRPGGYGLSMLDGGTGRFLWGPEGPLTSSAVWRGCLLDRYEGGINLIDPVSGVVKEAIPVPRGSAYMTLQRGSRLICHIQETTTYFGFDLASGEVLWERDLVADIAKHVKLNERFLVLEHATSPDLFLVTPRGPTTLALSVVDGSIVWQAPVMLNDYRPAAHEGRLYGAGSSHGSDGWEHFIALDEKDGRIIYDIPYEEQLRPCYYAKNTTIEQGKLALGFESGHLVVFDLATGLLVWSQDLKKSIWGTAEADGRLLATAADGNLLVFEDRQ